MNSSPYRDETYRALRRGDDLLILSVEDQLRIGSGSDVPLDLSSYRSVRIYAESVAIDGVMKVRELFLSTHALSVGPDAAIDARGGDGAPGGADTKKQGVEADPGGPGEPGGKVALFVGSTDGGLLNLTIRADGGKGGAGQNNEGDAPDSKGGKGGDAGAGGTVSVVALHRAAAWLSAIRTVNAAAQNADGKACRAALATLARSIRSDPDLASSLVTDTGSSLIDEAATIDGLLAAWADSGFESAGRLCGRTATAIEGLLLRWEIGTKRCLSAAAGGYGVHGLGLVAGDNGAEANDGVTSCLTVSGYGALPRSVADELLIAHPEQCAMLLQKAETLYFALDPSDRDGVMTVAGLLDRLVDRTRPIAEAGAADEVVRAYGAAATTQTLQSASVVSSFREIYCRASALRQQLSSGLNYLGRGGDYAPLASASSYIRSFNEQVDWFSELEAAYDGYFESLSKNAADTVYLRAALSSATQTMQDALADAGDLRKAAGSILNSILLFEQPITELRGKVDDAVERFKDELHRVFDFDMEQLLTAVGTVAFAPESGWMWATQIAQLGYKFDTKVTGSDGTAISKKYLVRQVDSIEGSIKSLLEGYSTAADGTLTPDDAGAALLLANQSALEQSLDQVYEKIPTEVNAVKDALRAYVDEVLRRNGLILDYNAAVLTMTQRTALAGGIQAKMVEINQQLVDTRDPSLGTMSVFVSSLFHQSRQQIMKSLIALNQAYRFYALDDFDGVMHLLRGTTELRTAALRSAQIAISDRTVEAINRLGHLPQRYPSDPGQPGLMVHLSGAQTKQLAQQNRVLVRIPVADKTTSSELNPFARFADVRLLKARCWVDGAGSENPAAEVHIELTHTGKESIVSTSGDVYGFSHDPVSLLFSYNLQTKVVREDGDIVFRQPDAPGGGTFALFGPFTWWQIQIDPKVNVGLSLDNVSGVRLEFHFANYSFG
ncbi:hypothetical protein [Paraburkholderia sp. SIMBA_054]|uniref:hypothetical protein n=1 Tax=Paraburkholderia sp. SIMBA_054 TaxID=3085795 RepID=UPI003978E6F4